MQKLLDYGNDFVEESTWKDFALVKLCLCAVGIMWGMAIPKKAHKPVVFIAVLVFVATYIPLILKFLRIIDDNASKNM